MSKTHKRNKYPSNLSSVTYAQKAHKYQDIGNTSKAEKFIKKALQTNPNNAEYLHFLGILQHQNGKPIDAVNSIQKAISLNKNNHLYYYHLGIVYKDSGEIEKAILQQKTTLSMDPTNISYLNEIAVLLMELNQLSEASKYLQKALSINNDDIASLVNMAHLLNLDFQVIECIKFATKAISLNPNISQPYIILGKALNSSNHFKEGFELLTKGMSIAHPNSGNKGDPVYCLMDLLYQEEYSKEMLYGKHKAWANVYFPDKITLKPKISDTPDKMLNVGFISSDFKQHSVPHFLFPLFENINTDKFHIYCYSGVSEPDNITEKLKTTVFAWCDIHKQTDEESIKQIKNDKIDILIDLSGHSLGNYLNLFGQKPAPVQFTFLGYPFSTGLKNIDYKITDNFADPGNTTANIHSEKLVKLEPSFLCYQPDDLRPIYSELPVERNKFITFGSFNNFNKLSPHILSIWSDLLKQVPNSVLILKNNRPVSDLLREFILSNFKSNNIDESRIIIHNPLGTTLSHLDQYNDIDISLDTYPYNGTTTTIEALLMGVPVITLSGDSHVNRVGNSILNNVNLPELIATNREQFINIALELANDIKQIKYYRENLRGKLLDSPLTDAVKYSRSFEDILRNAWKIFCTK